MGIMKQIQMEELEREANLQNEDDPDVQLRWALENEDWKESLHSTFSGKS